MTSSREKIYQQMYDSSKEEEKIKRNLKFLKFLTWFMIVGTIMLTLWLTFNGFV